MSLQADLRYPFNEDGWYKTIGLGMVFEYLTFLVLPGLFLAGYYIRVMRETAAGEAEPPAFGDYGELAVDGIKALLILFAYLLIPSIVVSITYIPTILSALQGSLEGALVSLLIGMLVSISMMTLFAYGGVAGLVNFAHTGSMRSAFSPSLLGIIASGAWLKAWLKILVTGGVSFVLSAAFAVFPPALIAHVVLIPFQVKYFFTVYARIFSRAFATAAGTATVTAATDESSESDSTETQSADSPEAPTAAAENDGADAVTEAVETESATAAGATTEASSPDAASTPQGATDTTPTDQRPAELEQPAQRLQRPASTESVTDGVERLSATIETIVEETNAVEQGIVDPDATPVEQAQAIRKAADGGTLVPEPDTEDDQILSGDEAAAPTLTSAVRDASRRTAPQTDAGRRLVDALERADEVGEQQVSDALQDALEALDRGESLSNTLADIGPGSDRREIARTLDRGSASVGGEVGTGLASVGDALDGVVSELESSRRERQQLADDAETLCDAADDQTALPFDTTASTDQRLGTLSNRLRDGTVAVTDRERSMSTLASNVADRTGPESSLSQTFLDSIRGESMDAGAREETIADALAAIDSTETLRHRLEGVSPDEVDDHEEFRQKYDLNFPLLADTDNEIAKAYGVWREKQTFGNTYEGIVRSTFLIDEDGEIIEIFDNVRATGHVERLLRDMPDD